MKKLISTIGIVMTIFVSFGQDSTSVDDFLELSLEELLEINVVVGSKTIDKIEETPGSVYLIDRKKIDASNAQTLEEVLNLYVPGLDALPTYFRYGNSATGVYNRGILSDFNQQVLILWNGENKFNDATFGSPHLLVEYPLDNVERIEVNSSSPSPLLGGSAMMTINIITSESTINGYRAHFNNGFSEETGQFSRRVSVAFGDSISDWKIGGGLQYFDREGFDFETDNISTNNSFNGLRNGNRGSISMQLNVKSPDEKLEIGSSYRNIVNDAFVSGLTYSESSDVYKYQGITFMNYLKVKPIEGLEISTGYTQSIFNNYIQQEQFIPVGVNQTEKIPYGINIKNANFYVQSNYLKKFDAYGSHTVLGGVRFENEGQLDNSIVVMNEDNVFEDQTEFRRENYGVSIPNSSRNIYTAFIEDNWQPRNNISVLLGLRADIYDNYNDKTSTAINPRIGLVYNINESLLIKGLFATAVRPPSLYEISGSNFLPLLYGNENVELENLTTYELNAVYKKDKVSITLTGYLSRFNDRISYEQSTLDTTISIAANSGETEVIGTEVNFEYQIRENRTFFLNSSFLVSEDKKSNANTPFIPQLYINSGILYGIQKFDLIATMTLRGNRELPSNIETNIDELESINFNLNSTIRYNFNDKNNVYILAQNILNTENTVPLSQDGFFVPLNQRLFMLGLTIGL